MSCLYVFKFPHGKTLNFLHQCELCAKDHLAERAETIRQQQAEIDRLTEQRDRLRVAFVQNMIRAFPDKTHSEISTLIAEIEAGK